MWRRIAFGTCLAFACALALPAMALETITAGAVGSPTSSNWPWLIGAAKGFFAEQGIEIDMVYAPTAPGVMQQLAAGSLDIIATSGVPEPIHAIEKGAPVAVLRLMGQVPPYALLAKPTVASVADLRGKTICLGGLVDITRIYMERIGGANGLKWGDYDATVIGATGARFAALKSGAIDATLLVPPFSFYAQASGFRQLALAIDTAKDLPFTGSAVSIAWAEKHRDTAKRLLKALDKSVQWFYDDANRQGSIDILGQSVRMDPKAVEASYDFLRKIQFFAPTSEVSKKKLTALIKAMKDIGDIEGTVDADRLMMPGLTEAVE